jgi:hypothetical protein
MPYPVSIYPETAMDDLKSRLVNVKYRLLAYLYKANYKDGELHGIERIYDDDGKEYSSLPRCHQKSEDGDMSNCEQP